MIDLSKVTRFEVIGNNVGRMIVLYGVEVELSLQDDGRTLKAFVKRAGVEAQPISWVVKHGGFINPNAALRRLWGVRKKPHEAD